VKSQGSTLELQWKLRGLNIRGVKGILGVRVKSVDIERNTDGEGTSLADD
jgi:hypothetical protein